MKPLFKKVNYLLQLALLSGFCHLSSQNVDLMQTLGPEKGNLVIMGGGQNVEEINQVFIELAGGFDAHIVVVPTAAGAHHYSDLEGWVSVFKKAGAKKVSMLHTYDREVADSDEFVSLLRKADGVWFGGGRQWRLVDAYKGTKFEDELWNVLKRGGVIGGSSAGATIQGSYLARGDTKNNQIMMGDHEEGLGFISNIAIDQHSLARNRHFDMFDILSERPELLGLSIDEETAVIVKGNHFEVIGNSYVLVYDGNFWSREGASLKNIPPENQRFYFLRAGDRYDLKHRKVLE
jgi:cyanophycinase